IRRHTRFSRDWSSDVCSSDLTSFKMGRVRFPLKAARRNAPKAPTPPASVGVATPIKIDPSTSTIKKTGGRKLRKIRDVSAAALRSEERRVGKEGRERG